MSGPVPDPVKAFAESMNQAFASWLQRQGVDCALVTRVWEEHKEGFGCDTCGFEPYELVHAEYVDSDGRARQWTNYDLTLGQCIAEILKGWD
tara:strand:+ start:5061 stop:5336 length:276 start_codon:yes stop_codon:yes gene_type:complete